LAGTGATSGNALDGQTLGVDVCSPLPGPITARGEPNLHLRRSPVHLKFWTRGRWLFLETRSIKFLLGTVTELEVICIKYK
jgi:hypothetical protein